MHQWGPIQPHCRVSGLGVLVIHYMTSQTRPAARPVYKIIIIIITNLRLDRLDSDLSTTFTRHDFFSISYISLYTTSSFPQNLEIATRNWATSEVPLVP